ncbi:MAG TPA: AMP-binding protein [Acidimicrobiales bacterium]|nr:AMP-binding protein [Acidimicrobiales bacterium]
MSIPELLAATDPALIAVVDGDVTLTYGELRNAARRVGATFGGGERVAIWAPNCWQWIVAVLGIWEAGATLVPINTRFKGAEAEVILQRSGASTLLTVRDFLGVDYASMVDAPGLRVIDLDGLPEAEPVDVKVTDDDVSDILFTSGTTGVPKGVVMTHGRTLTVARDWVAMTGLRAGDRYLMVNPYFHMFGLKAGILACVAAGATMYPEAVFDAGRALQRVQDARITVFPGAPTLYESLLDHPDRDTYDLSSLRVAVTGAADIPVTLIERVRTELPFELVVTGYGLTEAGTVSATSADDDATTVATTVGRARPGYEMRIDGHEPVGEVLVRSATVMREYLDDPEATAAAIDADGWLHTGDLGTIGDDGCLRIVGRSKDMFIVGGFNAYPAEIENLLLRHAGVAQAAVIGVPDERLGEVGMAFVVGDVDPDELVAWAKENMANYKVPRRVEVVAALPVNATGKVVKDELRAMVTR